MINDELMLWLSRGFDYEIFPRKIRIKSYSPSRGVAQLIRDIHGLKPIIDYINKRNRDNREALYVNLYSNIQLANSIYDTVMFDIDAHDNSVTSLGEALDIAYERLQTVRNFLLDLGFDFSRVYITGRGFHAYVDFTPVVIDWFDNAYLATIKGINQQLGGEYIDEKYYNVRFFDRIPFSRNVKIGRYNNGVGVFMRRIDFTKNNWREAILGVAEHRYFDDFPQLMLELRDLEVV